MTNRRPAPWMRSVAAVTLCSLAASSLASCASTTIINSQPQGARLYLNGEPVGVTPYAMTDTKTIGSVTTVRLEWPGYEPTTGVIARNEEFDAGACIGGVFLLFPFLWIMGYRATHTFELRPLGWTPYAPPGGYAPYVSPPPVAGAPPPPAAWSPPPGPAPAYAPAPAAPPAAPPAPRAAPVAPPARP